jgi:transcriptional regulator with XRE-family HTH domain
MLLNDVEKDIKIKCIESDTTQAELAEKIGTTSQYVNRIIKNNGGVLNKTFVKMMEGLGYDIRLTYEKREAKDHE